MLDSMIYLADEQYAHCATNNTEQCKVKAIAMCDHLTAVAMGKAA